MVEVIHLLLNYIVHVTIFFILIGFFSSGNHILTEEDLALFHWSLLGPDHPLNGLRVSVLVPELLTCILVEISTQVHGST